VVDGEDETLEQVKVVKVNIAYNLSEFTEASVKKTAKVVEL
jgi:hypothetical protein